MCVLGDTEVTGADQGAPASCPCAWYAFGKIASIKSGYPDLGDNIVVPLIRLDVHGYEDNFGVKCVWRSGVGFGGQERRHDRSVDQSRRKQLV